MYLEVCHITFFPTDIDQYFADVLGVNDGNPPEPHTKGLSARPHIHSRTFTMAEIRQQHVRLCIFRSISSVHFYSNWQLSPKQDHLVCFLAGSLMLGATTTGMRGSHVSRPPNSAELTKTARAEWALGEELLKTCLETHKTATFVFFFFASDLIYGIGLPGCRGLSPEIIYFHTPNEGNDPQPKKDRDWYIKNNA
jgi:hypothetical protein